MGKFMLSMPDDLHDVMRHKAIDNKKRINDMIIEAIQEKYNNNEE